MSPARSPSQVGNIGGALGGIINQNLGQGLQNLTGKTLDQHADIRGTATILSRPAITANWRMEPNLTAQVAIGDSALSIAGIKIGVSNEVKPMLDRQVNEQVAALQARLRADPFLEQAARRQWAKMCRSVSLGAAGAGLPDLWLEVRPTRAFAGQPRIDAQTMTLVIGVQAETRVVPAQTQPDCPFPATLELVPQSEQGRVNIAVPIDVPFTEVNRLLAAQLIGKTFPQDGAGPYEATIRAASVAASGDRLLISLRVKAREKASWLGLGAEANVHVWGRPVLDRDQQVLRLTDIALDVDSEAAFGLLERRRPGGRSVPEGHARRKCRHRSQAVRRQRPQEHRGRDRRLPHRRAWRPGGCESHRSAAHRHRIRRQDATGDRGGERDRQCDGEQPAGAVTPDWVSGRLWQIADCGKSATGHPQSGRPAANRSLWWPAENAHSGVQRPGRMGNAG